MRLNFSRERYLNHTMEVLIMTDHDATITNASFLLAKAANVAETDVFIFRFLGSEDKETFFTRAQRSRMVYEILSATTFGREKKGEVSFIYTFATYYHNTYIINVIFCQVGISRLVEEGAFNAAFPLHDVKL